MHTHNTWWGFPSCTHGACVSELPDAPNRYMAQLRLRHEGQRQRQDADAQVETAPHNFSGGKFSDAGADAHMET